MFSTTLSLNFMLPILAPGVLVRCSPTGPVLCWKFQTNGWSLHLPRSSKLLPWHMWHRSAKNFKTLEKDHNNWSPRQPWRSWTKQIMHGSCLQTLRSPASAALMDLMVSRPLQRTEEIRMSLWSLWEIGLTFKNVAYHLEMSLAISSSCIQNLRTKTWLKSEGTIHMPGC